MFLVTRRPYLERSWFTSRLTSESLVSTSSANRRQCSNSDRLLTSKQLLALLPAVKKLVAQNGLQVQVRSGSSLHDRYVFVDKKECYQSGASFKDGAKRSPTTLTQITDAFDVMFETYQRMWGDATVHEVAGDG